MALCFFSLLSGAANPNFIYPTPPSPPTPTTPTMAAAAAAAAAIYGSSLLPSLCMQNVFLHYQKLVAECHQLGINKLAPIANASSVFPSPAKSIKGILQCSLKRARKIDRLTPSLEESISEPHPLDLCTKRSLMMTNNNRYPGSTKPSAKGIWSPASSCEEENEQKSSFSDGSLSCDTCQRRFVSPTKLEVHCRKVHPQEPSNLQQQPFKPQAPLRKERVFKVARCLRYLLYLRESRDRFYEAICIA